MYAKKTSRPMSITFSLRAVVVAGLTGCIFSLASNASAQPQVIRNITQASQRLELTVNTSRILTLDKRVPKMVVNNPELVSVTPISANQVQIAARKPGVTQINLWDEDDQVYTVDLMIYGDVRELEHALKRLFPESSVKVIRLTNSLVLEGFVERPEAVSPIVRLAEDYAPKVVNNITVGGVQQILLKVKVMEVSRTKLRTLGVDWAAASSDGSVIASSVAGLITSATTSGGTVTVQSAGPAGGETFKWALIDGSNGFFGFLEALQQNNVAKVLADPTITAVSGRPAHFNVGGEIPIPIPQGLGQVAIEYKKFGTQVDFVPIVLGNGNIRLEVRPRVSELDDSQGAEISGFTVPAFTTREVDTAVELKAGQTLALAGLVQTRIEAQERGLPFVSDLPIVGSAFRSVRESVNEIELLIMVTPEFADGLEPHEVPQCGPGMETVSPTNCQLYWGGQLEVPSCGPCGPHGDPNCQSCAPGQGTPILGGSAYVSDAVPTQATPGIVIEQGPVQQLAPQQSEPMHQLNMTPIEGQAEPITVPNPTYEQATPPAVQPAAPAVDPGPVGTGNALDPTANYPGSPLNLSQRPGNIQLPYSRDRLQVPVSTANRPRTGTSTPGLMGPIGYDVE